MDRSREVELSINKKYRHTLWGPFIRAIKDYKLIEENDRIAVCISGGKDSMCLAKLMQMLQRHSEFPFEVEYLVMDPGYNEVNRRKIEDNAATLGIPVQIFETTIFDIANSMGPNPCYLCAKMRRGALYKKARELGCNKIALGHHFNDVIETTLLSMFYASQLQAMIPKLHSQNYEGMELIRPLYRVHEDDIISWCRYNNLEFIQCACRFTEESAHDENLSKRKEVKRLLKELKKDNPDIEISIFNSLHKVNIEMFPGYKADDEYHSFLEHYDERKK